jgi:hypothetical protein
MVIHGGCSCRGVRYRSTAAPLLARVYGCRVCQYFGAGNGTVHLCFARDTVTMKGSLNDYRRVATAAL